MAKNRFVFIALLTVLVFIAGCSPADSEPAESQENETAESPNEHNEADANLFESNPLEHNKAEPNEAESTKAEPNDGEIIKVEPNEVEPNNVKPPPKVTFHDKFAGILREFVDDKGMVDYRRLKQKRGKLRMLLSEFTKLKRKEYNSWSKEDKIAFWINAYNMRMLYIIIDNYPIDSYWLLHLIPGWEPDSILHIDKRIDGIKKQKFYIMDEVFTLPQVEKLFLRDGFDEPRAFFALFYATLSGPPLRNEPYSGDKLYKQLDDQAKNFISSPLGFRIDRDKRRVYLSTILQPSWFGSGFISRYGTNKKFKDQEPAVRAVLSFITNYISKKDKRFLEVENYSIEYIKYSWRLNDNSKK